MSLKLKHFPVVCEREVRWKGGIGRFVFEFMGEVREPRALRLQLRHDFQSLVEAEVGLMRFGADGVQYQQVQITQFVHRFLRNVVDICHISEVVKAIGEDGEAAMEDVEGLNTDSVQFERFRDFVEC
jgi:hypothetical protein